MNSTLEKWIVRLRYLGALAWVFAFIALIPLVLLPFLPEVDISLSSVLPFLTASIVSLSLGAA
ncbi:MAG: hypothetical protein ACOC82_03145, partial [Candidatus Bipolaricaulota bacterium]